MATLYQISNQYQEILDLCSDPSADSETLAIALNDIVDELNAKVRGGIAVIRELQSRSVAIDAEIKRLCALKKATDNNLERLKNYYVDNLAAVGAKKISTDIGTMTVAKAGGNLPVVIEDEDAVPPDYKRVVYQTLIDKDALRDALVKGGTVDGARLGSRRLYLKVS